MSNAEQGNGRHREDFERLARGPKGEPGEAGERGRGLSLVQGRAVVVLFLIGALAGIGNLFWTSHVVGTEQGKWCSLIVTLDQANAAAPKKPAPGTFTAAFVAEIRQLRQDLGCTSSAAVPGGTP
jgi:hypothetical protein